MAKEFDFSIVSNPRIFKEERLAPHSAHAVEGQEVICLNDVWKINVVKNPSLIPKDFYKSDFDTSSWDDIRVPAHIQTEGFDRNAYVNYQYPWDGHEDIKPGQIPTEYNPVACYSYDFDIDEIKDKNYIIAFDGVESNLVLFINGQYVGYSEDSYTVSEFDITEYIHAGANNLSAIVYKWCSSCFIDDQDYFRFSGIFRDVYISLKNKTHIDDIKITTDLDDTYTDAVLNVEIKATGEYSKIKYVVNELADITTNASSISEAIKAPKLWSAEDPNLYLLTVELLDDKGNVIEKATNRFGFRKFEMKDGIMLINGKRIVFNGVNRHEFSALDGRAISYEDTKYDIINMKKNNINALRTCHYPDCEFVYDLCDEYGLYLISETNMESHGSWNCVAAEGLDKSGIVPGNNPDFLDVIIDRATSMIEKEKNHPSIVIWSCGNESYGGENIYKMSNAMRALDPTRLIHYEGIFWDRSFNDTSDMESQMYTPADGIKKFLEEHPEKPFICCEYMHAMGNGVGAMHKYTDLTKTEKRYQGGFIWDYIDQALVTKNEYGEEYMAYGGDFDERPCDYEFSGDGICYADRTDSPKMQPVKYNYQPIDFAFEEAAGKLKVKATNYYLFTDGTKYDFEILVEKNGKEICKTEAPDALNNIAPDSSVEFEIELPDMSEEGVYAVTVNSYLKNDESYANKGHLVSFGQFTKAVRNKSDFVLIDTNKKYGESLLNAFKVIDAGYNVGVKGKNFEVLFSKLNPGMTSYKFAGKEYIKVIPRPNFFRAPTDNDRANFMPYRYADWKAASLCQAIRDPYGEGTPVISAFNSGEDFAEVEYTYYLPTSIRSKVTVKYTVKPDGSVKVSMNYPHVEGLVDMPEFGMLFELPLDLENVEWFGLGKEETYADKTGGAKLSWYSNKVADNMAKYLRPQECGNKMDVYEASVTDNRGRGIKFYGNGMCFSALPYTPSEIETALHPWELPRQKRTVVRASLAQMGVGGDDTWGAKTHPEYLLPNDKDLEFEFVFKGI